MRTYYINADTMAEAQTALEAAGIISDDGVGGYATSPRVALSDLGCVCVYDNDPVTDAPRYDAIDDGEGGTTNVRRMKEAGGHWYMLALEGEPPAALSAFIKPYPAEPVPVFSGVLAADV